MYPCVVLTPPKLFRLLYPMTDPSVVLDGDSVSCLVKRRHSESKGKKLDPSNKEEEQGPSNTLILYRINFTSILLMKFTIDSRGWKVVQRFSISLCKLKLKEKKPR